MNSRIIMVVWAILLVAALPALAGSGTMKEYNDQGSGVSFCYPQSFGIDEKSSTKKPFSVVFKHQSLPFIPSIQFREVTRGESLQDYIRIEREALKKGGYRAQVKGKKYMVEKNAEAMEFIRKTDHGDMINFIFTSKKTGRLFSLWLVTSSMSDPENLASQAYKVMRSSIRLNR